MDKDLMRDIGIGVISFLSGFFVNLLLITPKWRKHFNNEISLKLNLELIERNRNENKIVNILFNFDFNCQIEQIQIIKSAFWVLPKELTGTPKINQLGMSSLVYGREDVYIAQDFARSYTHQLFLTENIINHINEGRMDKISLVIETNVYGKVKSNSVKLNLK